MTNFLAGLGDFFAGFGLVLGVGSIRKWAIIPMILNALLFGTMAVLVFLFAGDAVTWMVGQAKSGWGTAGHVALQVLVIIVGLAAVVVLSLVLSSVVAAPFYTKLAEAALLHLTGRQIMDVGPLWKIALKTILQEAGKLAIFIGVQALLFGIGLIPLIGQVIAGGVTFLLLAFQFADYSLEAYGYGVLDRYKFTVANTGRSLGFGSAAFLTTLVPLMGIFTAPAAIAGAARMVVRIKGDNVR
ncbi:MAG: EI24 domain-containing protein [Planctomycetia bacterium]|nr:EI24 domain-containing protein [Planctomycetia bacterium]